MRGARRSLRDRPRLTAWVLPWLAVVVTSSAAHAGWYDASWSYRKRITIDHTQVSNTDQNDFPVLISRTDADWASAASGGKANGGDIVFTASDGTTQLSHEIETYENGTGQLIAWIKVPLLSASADTELYVYYGNAAAPDQWDVADTWDPNFHMVQHLHETAGTHYDATANDHDGTPQGAFIQDATGKVDGADQFDGTDGYIVSQNDSSLTGNPSFTAEAWVYIPSGATLTNVYPTILWWGSSSAYESVYFGLNDSDINRLYVGFFGGGMRMTGTFTNDAWHHFAWVRAGGGASNVGSTLYVDGESVPLENQLGTGTPNIQTSPYYVQRAGGGTFFEGTIDEVRVSNVARSADWVKTCYTNQNDEPNFSSLEGQEFLDVVIDESGGSTDVDEAGPTLDTYTVVLGSEPTANVIVTVDPDDQVDLGGGTGSAITLTFMPADWDTPQTVTVTADDDDVVEGAHTATITHSAASADGDYNGIAISDVTANVTDDDIAGVAVTESGGATDVDEAGATDDYTVVLESEPTANVVVTVDPDDQVDLGAGPGSAITLTFLPADWDTPQTVTVSAVDDDIVGGGHTATITHTAASADGDYDGFAIPDVTANVTDDDIAGVAVTQSGGSTDIDEAGPTDDAYTLVLDSEPTANVVVTVDPDDQVDLGAGTGSVITLMFTPASWDTPQTVTVTAVDDSVIEGAHTATITHSTASTDGDYNGIAIPNVTANVTDNDAASVIATESGGSTIVDEAGSTSDSYTVVLGSTPSGNVAVTVAPDDQTDLGAVAGSPITLTFTPANWDTPQTVTVAAVDDRMAEGQHTGAITHTASSGDPDYDLIAIPDVTVIITDNDTAGVTIIEGDGLTSVNEAGPTSDSYTIALDTKPFDNVTIIVTPDGQTDLGSGAGTPVTLGFSPATWDMPQTVTVTAVDDGLIEGTHTSSIIHASASADADYDDLSLASVVVNITDNDVLGDPELDDVQDCNSVSPPPPAAPCCCAVPPGSGFLAPLTGMLLLMGWAKRITARPRHAPNGHRPIGRSKTNTPF